MQLTSHQCQASVLAADCPAQYRLNQCQAYFFTRIIEPIVIVISHCLPFKSLKYLLIFCLSLYCYSTGAGCQYPYSANFIVTSTICASSRFCVWLKIRNAKIANKPLLSGVPGAWSSTANANSSLSRKAS